MNIEVVDNNETKVICPYCEKELKILIQKTLGGFLNTKSVFVCGECLKPIPVTNTNFT